jgi:CxxC motif-containing protein (DUF1111 family)
MGCGTSEATVTSDPVSTQEAAQQPLTAIGDPLPGTDPVAFAAARDNFAQAEDINDGLGPTFNGNSCAQCHGTPIVGGSGVQIERRFGRVDNGVFFGFDRAPDNEGGTLRQLFANGTYSFQGKTCSVALDAEPPSANVRAGRRATPLFGMGLVDAMPDEWFDLLALLEPSSTRGVVQRAVPPFPDPRDPTQGLGKTRVGRFGLKGQVTGLLSFSGDAYVNEMGITTQSCYKGTSILAFASENQPNNVTPAPGCNAGDLKPANPAGNPEIPEFTDDAVGTCAGGKTEVQDDMANFLFFMERLAPPPPDNSDPFGAAIGSFYFLQAGCSNCHVPFGFTTPSTPFNGVPGNYTFYPYSDFLGHDMGALGDGIGGTGDSVATTRIMRTPPLWGIRFNTQLLHDGRAHSIREAIVAHDGQGAAARDNFNALSSTSQKFLIRFVNSL